MLAARFLYLWIAPAAPLPSHRREGFSASAVLHLIAAAGLMLAPATPPMQARSVALTYVTSDAIASPTDAPDPVPPDRPGIREETVEGPALAPPLEVAGLELDIDKVRQQRNALFPFVTAALPFLGVIMDRYEPGPERLVNPFGRERRASNLPLLALSAEQMQATIDRAWSRRERWQNFTEIAALLSAHDPHDGDAAALMRGYLEQNLLQPYFDATTRDPRFWVMLRLAADHSRLIEFAGTFAAAHPSSRTTTELLFMLDEFAQASRDAMLMLLSTSPLVDLELTRKADREAYALAVSIHEHYRQWAAREGLDRSDTLRARFDDVRLRILRAIIASTPEGYGAGDARYLMGRILWDRNDKAGAYRVWSEITPDARDSYRAASSAIARELAIGDVPAVNIIGILGLEYRRWITFSSERLARFGFGVDSF